MAAVVSEQRRAGGEKRNPGLGEEAMSEGEAGAGILFSLPWSSSSLVAAALVFTLSGCEGGSSGLSEAIVRDSAGVVIVESRSRIAAPSEWSVGETPTVEIGRTEGAGPEVFGAIQDVIRLGDGRIAVADGMAGEVRLFTADGAHVGGFGRRGEGPGEFSVLWRIFSVRGDSVAAVDNLASRVSIFSPEGVFGRSYSLPWIEGGGPPNVVGALNEGRLLLTAPTAPASQDVRSQATVLAYVVDDAGVVLRQLGEYLDRELGANGLGLGFGGQAIVAAGDSVGWYGHSSHFSLERLSLDGSVRRIVRLDRATRPVTGEDVSEAQRAVEQSLSQQGANRTLMQRIMDTEFAEAHPAHGRALVDEGGYLWVAGYEVPTFGAEPVGSAQESWDVFDSEGRWRTQLDMPVGFRLYQAGEDFVLGVNTDDLGVQRIHLYALSRE